MNRPRVFALFLAPAMAMLPHLAISDTQFEYPKMAPL